MSPAFTAKHDVDPRNNRTTEKGNASLNSDPAHGGAWTFLYSALLSYSEECTVIGVRPAMDPERRGCIRLIWACMVLAGVGLALYQIQDRINYYAGFPTATQVSIQQAKQTRFPQVTICNENRMRKSVAHDLGKSDLV